MVAFGMILDSAKITHKIVRVLGSILLSCASTLLCRSDGIAAPSIFWASDPVDPNETALVTGDGLADLVDIRLERLNDNSATVRAPSASTSVASLQANNSSVKFSIPAEFGAGAYRFTLVSKSGEATGYLNAPIVYWVQGDRGLDASVGGWLRVLGRDISRTNEAILSLASPTWSLKLHPKSWSLWDAEFEIPNDMHPGRYALRIWNGNGDLSTWRDAGMVEILRQPKSNSTIASAKDYGARGDGETDDTASINAELKSLGSHGGGTLYFPRGRYTLSDALMIPDHVTLKGEDRTLVSLNWKDSDNPPLALIDGYSDFAVEDLTIFASRHAHVISGGFAQDPAAFPGRNIAIRRVTLRATSYGGHITPADAEIRLINDLKFSSGGPDSVRLAGDNLEVVDADIYGSGRSLYLFRAHGAYIARNHFYNGRLGWYSLTGSDGVIFENNTVTGADLQSEGGGVNTQSRQTPFSRNVLFKNNSVSLVHGWDRQGLTSDGPGGYYYGHVSASSGGRLVLLQNQTVWPIEKSPLPGAGLFVLGGTGAGEYARIRTVDAQSVTLDRILAVPPGKNSIITIVPTQENYLILNNRFSDAAVATQFFGTSIDHVVAGNVSVRTEGFRSAGLYYHHPQPSWYVQFLGNSIQEGNNYDFSAGPLAKGKDAMVAVYGHTTKDNNPLALGQIVRRNELLNNAHIEVEGVGGVGVVDAIVELNDISRTDKGIVVNAGAAHILLRNNTFNDVGTDISDQSH